MDLPGHLPVAGIDVGGPKKGFHLVTLDADHRPGLHHVRDPEDAAAILTAQQVRLVGVDAPCTWSASGTSREAERALRREKIISFCTPTREKARGSAFYDWMFNGESLYRGLKNQGYALSHRYRENRTLCFETFPHAITCALKGKIVSASNKRMDRGNILEAFGYSPRDLGGIDNLDAMLCAITARFLSVNQVKLYGTPGEGAIIVPRLTNHRPDRV